jgi:uncharacterized delta-60 repeat protein
VVVLTAALVLAFPAWLVGSQVSGLVTFSPGQPIRAADFNHNFQALETAQNDTDSKLTTLTAQVSVLPTASQLATTDAQVAALQGQVTTLQGQTTTLQGQVTTLQGQVTSLQSQNTTLTAQLLALKAGSITGAPDDSFNVAFGGPNTLGAANANASANGLVIDANQKIVVVETAEMGAGVGSILSVERFNPDASDDNTFGTGGVVYDNGAGLPSLGNAIALDTNGRILVTGGSTPAGAQEIMTLWRFNTNGTLDTTFGPAAHPGYVTEAGLNPPSASQGNAILLDPTGRILVAGSSNGLQTSASANMTVWRFNSDGTLDATFGQAAHPGFFDSAAKNQPVWGNGITLDSNGKILVAGTGSAGGLGISGMTVWRLTSSGALDTTFGPPNGYVADSDTTSVAQALTTDSKGRIVVAGQKYGATVPVMTVWRLLPTGAFDTSMGGTGIAQPNFKATNTPPYDIGNAVLIDSLGNILVAGVFKSGREVWRLTVAGGLDPTFGLGTGMTTDFPANSSYPFTSGTGIVFDGQGRLVVSGSIEQVGPLLTASVSRFH